MTVHTPLCGLGTVLAYESQERVIIQSHHSSMIKWDGIRFFSLPLASSTLPRLHCGGSISQNALGLPLLSPTTLSKEEQERGERWKAAAGL